MSRCNGIRLQDIGVIHHPFPFDKSVAVDAGIGRASVQIGVHKGRNHMTSEIRQAVEGVVFDPKIPRGVTRVVDLTAPAFTSVAALPRAERHADHFIARLFQQ